MRINKFLAHKNIVSRREADALIVEKKVTVNGKQAVMGQKIEEGDAVEIVGEIESKSYLAYYKGRGVVSHSPALGETDIASKLAKDYGISHVFPVGRLDKDSEGLMILSNDGRMTSPLLDPKLNHEKEYEVLVDKKINNMFVRAMEAGVDIEGYRTKKATVIASTQNDKRFRLTITEGKKHQIRRMCVALGFQVQSLKRIRIMNIKIGKLKPNQYRKIEGAELETFLKKLGL